jgi:hypothetical protein
MSYLGVGDLESVYKDAFAKGSDSKEKFQARCAGYGFTAAKHGSSWDDMCIGHESQNKLGPFSSAGTGASSSLPKWVLPVGIGAGALLLVLLVRR